MNAKTVVLGLVVVLIGVGLVSGSYSTSTDVRLKAISYNTGKWSLSAGLVAGDTVTVLFREHAFWVQQENGTTYFDISDDEAGVDILHVFITLTDPVSNQTVWDNELAVYSPPSGQGVGIKRLVGYYIQKTQNGSIDTSGVHVDPTAGLMFVGGVIPISGTYTVQLATYPPRPCQEGQPDQPPSLIGFYHNVTTTAQNFTYLLPVGGVTAVFGTGVFFLGVKDAIVRHVRRNHVGNRRTEIK